MTRQDAKSTESQNSSPGRGSVTNRNLAFTSSVKAWMLVHPVLFYVIMSSPAENRAGQQFHARSCRYHTRNSVSAILYTGSVFIVNQHYQPVRAREADLRRRWNDGTTCNCHLVQVNLVSHERHTVPVVQPQHSCGFLWLPVKWFVKRDRRCMAAGCTTIPDLWVVPPFLKFEIGR